MYIYSTHTVHHMKAISWCLWYMNDTLFSTGGENSSQASSKRRRESKRRSRRWCTCMSIRCSNAAAVCISSGTKIFQHLRTTHKPTHTQNKTLPYNTARNGKEDHCKTKQKTGRGRFWALIVMESDKLNEEAILGTTEHENYSSSASLSKWKLTREREQEKKKGRHCSVLACAVWLLVCFRRQRQHHAVRPAPSAAARATALLLFLGDDHLS